MTDREKVIKALECCSSIDDREACPADCPYAKDFSCQGAFKLMQDALALLKEQEPMKPKEELQGGSYYATCGNCGYPLTELTRQHGWPIFDWPPFCSNCGRRVMWDD